MAIGVSLWALLWVSERFGSEINGLKIKIEIARAFGFADFGFARQSAQSAQIRANPRKSAQIPITCTVSVSPN
eukprot:344967-Prorocentrum_minimum.AAC.1